MSNWGKPDFDESEEATIDYEALHRRIKAEDSDALIQWPIREYPVRPGYARDLVQAYCVRHKRWQEVRLSMKGKATHEKLAILKRWWDSELKDISYVAGIDAKPEKWFVVEIQIGNYLGALRRGGQLDEHNRVRRYR